MDKKFKYPATVLTRTEPLKGTQCRCSEMDLPPDPFERSPLKYMYFSASFFLYSYIVLVHRSL